MRARWGSPFAPVGRSCAGFDGADGAEAGSSDDRSACAKKTRIARMEMGSAISHASRCLISKSVLLRLPIDPLDVFLGMARAVLEIAVDNCAETDRNTSCFSIHRELQLQQAVVLGPPTDGEPAGADLPERVDHAEVVAVGAILVYHGA